MSADATGFAVIYRFRVLPENEAAFIAAWSRLTELIRDHRGGRGSRLHRGDDGLLYAYAQWPDREAWAAEGNLPLEADDLLAAMRATTAERFEPIPLAMVADLLLPEGGGKS